MGIVKSLIENLNTINAQADTDAVNDIVELLKLDELPENAKFDAMIYEHAKLRHQREQKVLTGVAMADFALGASVMLGTLTFPKLLDLIGGIALEKGSLKKAMPIALVSSAVMIGRAGYLYAQSLKSERKVFDCDDKVYQYAETVGTNRVILNADQKVGAGLLAFYGDKELDELEF